MNSDSVSVPFGVAVAKKNGRQKIRKTQHEHPIERGGRRGMRWGHDHPPRRCGVRHAVRPFLSATVTTRAARATSPITPPTINNAVSVILVRNARDRPRRTFALFCVAPAALRSLPCVVHAVFAPMEGASAMRVAGGKRFANATHVVRNCCLLSDVIVRVPASLFFGPIEWSS